MATATSFDLVNIRNYNFVKMNGSGISCNCSAQEYTCKDLNTFTMINQDSNKGMDDNEDGIPNENFIDGTRDLRYLDERILNVFKDLVMLETSYITKALIDSEDLITRDVQTSQLKPLKMKKLDAYDNKTIMDMLSPLKEKMLSSLQNQLKWKMTTYDFDLVPG